MPFFKIRPGPGFVTDPTEYASEGSWRDGSWVRFRGPDPETMGGWRKLFSSSFQGLCRGVYHWITAVGTQYAAVGTTWKLYVARGSDLYDVTSIRSTVTLGTDPFTTVNGSGVVTVAHASHGAGVGDYVTLSGTAAVGGIGTGDLDAEHRINTVPTGSTYTILVPTAATSSTSGGGTTAVAEYQDNVGLDYYVGGGTGWGVGAWGSGSWGGVRVLDAEDQLRGWSFDHFQDDLVGVMRGGHVVYWDESAGVTSRATRLSEVVRGTALLENDPIATTNTSATLTITDDGGHNVGAGDIVTISGAATTNGVPDTEINADHAVVSTPTKTTFTITVTTAATSTGVGGGGSVTNTYYSGTHYGPSKALSVLVSDQDRHVLLFGTTDINSTDIDPLLVRWSDANNVALWRPDQTNLSGGKRLSSGSFIVASAKARQEILVWTDSSLHSLRYTGAPAVYSMSEMARDVSIASPNAWAIAGDDVYFMARGGFNLYRGEMEELECPVEDYVFSDFDTTQAYKVTCGTNKDFGEVIWFYPSKADATGEPSRYVVYNYRSKQWYFGSRARSYWTEAPKRLLPLASSALVYSTAVDSIATTSASTTVVVTHADHGMAVGDVVVLSGYGAVGGVATNVLNAQHTLTAVTQNTFSFVVPTAATSTAVGGGATGIVRPPQYLYEHEVGYAGDGAAVDSFIESSDMDIDDGDWVWFINRIIPDVKFKGSPGASDVVTHIIKGKDFPGNTMAQIISAGITPTTAQAHVRGRARQIALRLESSTSLFGWRLGSTRIDTVADGMR